jgi:hypothetical protein
MPRFLHFFHYLNTYNPHIVSAANILIALGTVALAFGIPWSIVNSRREERDTFYATLDRTYFEIQKLQIDHPHLCRVSTDGKTEDQIAQYDAFAYLTWNFVESIFDYSGNDAVLRETWQCVMHYESRRHADWFAEERNLLKFKTRFREHMESNVLSHAAPHAPRQAARTGRLRKAVLRVGRLLGRKTRRRRG